MTPESWTSGTAYGFAMQDTGSIIRRSLKYEEGVRPVINLKSDTTFSSGDGTISKPYVVS